MEMGTEMKEVVEMDHAMAQYEQIVSVNKSHDCHMTVYRCTNPFQLL